MLVSELMLQQTTVTAVIPYFERWMKRFPNAKALAEASEEEVLHLWQGLGYYSRARNLRRAAQVIVERHQGKTPVVRELLRELPGVGDYTAGAVAAFAGDALVPVLDANIARVVARLENYRKPIDTAEGKAFLDAAAQRLLPETGGCRHTSALMDLGAMICVARAPRCLVCPVQLLCGAESPEEIPVKRARPKTEEIMESRTIAMVGGKLWLVPSPGPRWRGLWLLPEWRGKKHAPDLTVIYPITRFRVTMKVFFSAKKPPGEAKGFPLDNLPPMPSPHRRAVEKFRGLSV